VRGQPEHRGAVSAHAPPDDYVARRTEMGSAEANRRFLAAARTRMFLVDTGFRSELLTRPDELSRLAGLGDGAARTVIRLETVAEAVAAADQDPDTFTDRFIEALHAAVTTTRAVGVKSVAAYRCGLALPGRRPSPAQIRAAARRWFGRGPDQSGWRLDDPVLVAHAVWTGTDLGLPVQFHVGFGDRDVRLHRSDPTLLTDLLHQLPATAPILLLHCYPYVRQAAYLAAVYPNVYLDVGLTLNYVGPARAAAVMAEALELAPFGKLLYSSDAIGLAELHFLGALTFRRGLASLLRARVADDEWSSQDGMRCADLVASGNAVRVYRLTPSDA
jgi:uncharacterized protein